MNIPWVAALQVARKLLPVVVDNAPELLKTLGRLRTPIPAEQPTPVDPRLDALHEQINAQSLTIAGQATAIEELRAALRETQRSLTLARSMLVGVLLLSVATFAYLLLRG